VHLEKVTPYGISIFDWTRKVLPSDCGINFEALQSGVLKPDLVPSGPSEPLALQQVVAHLMECVSSNMHVDFIKSFKAIL